MTETSVNPLFAVLIAIFASASWLGPNSIGIQMNIHTQENPEGWNLGSTLIVVNQISSIGAITFILIEKCTKIQINKRLLIFICLCIMAVSCIPCALFHKATIPFFGSQRSIILYFASFMLGGISILSDLLFMPFMQTIPPKYFQAYFVGVGLSALIPSVIGIAQGSSTYECLPTQTDSGTRLQPVFTNLKISVTLFYFIIGIWYCLAIISFILVAYKPNLISNLLNSKPLYKNTAKDNTASFIVNDDKELTLDDSITTLDSNTNNRVVNPSFYRDMIMLIMIATNSMQTLTLTPSLTAFAMLPYSSETYFWALITGSICQPLGAFAAFFVEVRRTVSLIGVYLISTTCSIIFVILAFQSPTPPMKGTVLGSALAILLTVVMGFIGSFCKSQLMECFRIDSRSPKDEDKRLFYAGLAIQIGALIGVILTFPAVNIFNVFESAPSC